MKTEYKQYGIFYQRENQNGKIKWERDNARFQDLDSAIKYLKKNKKDKYFNYKIRVRTISEWEDVEIIGENK